MSSRQAFLGGLRGSCWPSCGLLLLLAVDHLETIQRIGAGLAGGAPAVILCDAPKGVGPDLDRLGLQVFGGILHLRAVLLQEGEGHGVIAACLAHGQ